MIFRSQAKGITPEGVSYDGLAWPRGCPVRDSFSHDAIAELEHSVGRPLRTEIDRIKAWV